MVRGVFTYRSHAAAIVLLAALSLLLTQIPLFNYLGYEFSVVIALFWSLCASLLTVSLWHKSIGDPLPDLRAFLRRSYSVLLFPLMIPAIVIGVNAFVVRNCSLLQGAALFLLIVVPAILIVHAFSFLVVVSFNRWQKTLVVVGWLLMIAQIPYVTLGRPQIFAFNPIVGFFAGFTYDESLVVFNRLVMYRVGTLAFAAFLLLEAVLKYQRRSMQSNGPPDSRRKTLRAASVGLLAIAAVIWLFSDRLGLSSSERSIERTLGGRIETDHFVISYPDSLVKGIRLEQLAQLHEFYFDELVRILHVRPEKKIHSFLYATPEQKGRLVGASGTDFAKPWLSQLHINLNDVDATLKHEMVHVLAAEFGLPLLGIGLNSGLIEGLAVGIGRMEYEEPINRLAGMAYAAGRTPEVADLFSLSGFMKAPAGVSYTLAGSFCRFLIDRYGLRRFKLLYRTGEYEIIYGEPLPSLLRDWRRSISVFRFNEAEIQKAEYLFSRRSIFGKVCARVIANLNGETRSLLAAKKYDIALQSAERSLALTSNTDAIYQKTTSLLRLGRFQEAVSFARLNLADSLAGPSLLTLKLSLGDALWGIDSLESAMAAYADLLRAHLSASWDEALALRIEIMLRPELARELESYYLSPAEDSVRARSIEQALAHNPHDPVLTTLLARERIAAERYEDGLRLLDSLKPWSSSILEFSRQRRMGQLSFTIGKYEKAKLYYWQSLNSLYRDVQGMEIEEQIQYCTRMGSSPHR
ncbi:MAG TPA: hypothetical protein VMH23_04360 [Bacteroidota bacterium]|nr:hypothetical protein [Bacteroidota bacterium]